MERGDNHKATKCFESPLIYSDLKFLLPPIEPSFMHIIEIGLTQTYISIITSNLAAPQELMKPGLKRLTCLQSSLSILQVHKSHNPHALRTF